jgi:hypothetical protein
MWGRIIERVKAAIHDDTLKAAAIAAATAFAAGGATAFISGAWKKALFAVAGLALVSFFGVLLSAARSHDRELGEVRFDIARDDDARKRDSVEYERDQRARIAEATEGPFDATTHRAQLKALLERCRQYIANGRPAPIELLVVSDAVPHAPTVVAEAGRFDHSVLEKPRELFQWIERLAGMGRAHSSLLPGLNGEYRLVGLMDSALDENDKLNERDKLEIEHAASRTHGLLLAQRLAAFEQRQVG